MSGGEWLIRQHGPLVSRQGITVSHYETERITIEAGTASGTGQIVDDPDVTSGQIGLTFRYADGRVLTFPWANIVRAEYRPHPEP